MATLTDVNNPSFLLAPVNNNRTAWRSFGLPVILVVPHKRDAATVAIPNAGITSLRIYIEDVPQEAKVAGHQNIGRRFPDHELYSQTVDVLALADRLIDLTNLKITRDGETIELADARDGDLIHYTTNSGVRDTFIYLVGADYYDLSDILIDVELLPSDQYNLVYETTYFKRVISADGKADFLCIDTATRSLAIFKFAIDHPGRVIDEFYRLTPPPYLTNAKKSADTTVALYRPFTDILQDVMDEQSLLERINWVFDTPPEAIPYLSNLLGWDIPYFPQSLDQLRRAVLRRTVEFQNLKGSRRAIVNIFRLFGFEILISNLWWSADGQRLIRPDERLPLGYQDQEITTVAVDQVDPVLADYQISDFTTITIPLLFRPQEKAGLDEFTALRDGGQLTVAFYAATPGSAAQIELDGIVSAIKSNPGGWGQTADCEADDDGFLFPAAITEAMADKELAGFSQIHIAGKSGDPVSELLVGKAIPVKATGIRLNRETNTLSITFDGFSGLIDYRVYAFATYRRYEFSVPDVLASLQSNRFDLQILTQELAEFADPQTLEFAVEFLYKLKAFHSLLNVIRTRIELTETYQVTDLCVGGDFEQRYDIDAGRLQVPPAIIPRVPGDLGDCASLDPKSLGYKESDILYRLRVLANLPEEHSAWKSLDDRTAESDGQERIAPNQPPSDREACLYNPFGQDRKLVGNREEAHDVESGPTPLANGGDFGFAKNPELAPDAQTSTNADSNEYGWFTREHSVVPAPHCELDQITDHCYRGRVSDELLYRQSLIGAEWTGARAPCIGLGLGFYWTYPALSRVARPGVRRPASRSHTNKIRFSGQADEASRYYYLDNFQYDYLNQPGRLPASKQSVLGRLYRDYGLPTTETLHFSNRPGEPIPNQQRQLALERPNLEIIKPALHLPGCRFPTLNRLRDDFVSSYEARPWDFEPCGPRNVCGRTEPTYLNYGLEARTDGNEYLVFDEAFFTVVGNNLPADIPTLGDQTGVVGFGADDVVHEVYLVDATDNPAVELDSVAGHDPTDATLETDTPLFSSFITCGSTSSDYLDGYPAVTGFVDVATPDPTDYDSLLILMGLPAVAATGTQALFLLVSGIRDGSMGWRLDNGCSLAPCTGTEDDNPFCINTSYIDENGFYDFEPDHLLVEARLVADEEFKVEVTLLNGQIDSLLETI